MDRLADLEEENLFMRNERNEMMKRIEELHSKVQMLESAHASIVSIDPSLEEERVASNSPDDVCRLTQQLDQEKNLVEELARRLVDLQSQCNSLVIMNDTLKLDVLELLPLRLKLNCNKDNIDRLSLELRIASEDNHVQKAMIDRLKSELNEKIESKAFLDIRVTALEKEVSSLASSLDLKSKQAMHLQEMCKRAAELEKENEVLLQQKNYYERKSNSLSREVSRLVATPILNTIEEIKEVEVKPLQHSDSLLRQGHKRDDIIDKSDENIADDNCFVFLFGTKRDKSRSKKGRGKSNIF